MSCFQEHLYGCLHWNLFQLPPRECHSKEKHAGWAGQLLIGSLTLCTVQSHPVSFFKRSKVPRSHTHTHTSISALRKNKESILSETCDHSCDPQGSINTWFQSSLQSLCFRIKRVRVADTSKAFFFFQQKIALQKGNQTTSVEGTGCKGPHQSNGPKIKELALRSLIRMCAALQSARENFDRGEDNSVYHGILCQKRVLASL